MSPLSDLLTQARGDRSVRDVGRAVAKKYGVGESTVIPYFSGNHRTPQDRVLVALAKELSLNIGELRQVAGLPRGEREPYVPPTDANLLTERQRRLVDEVIRTLVDSMYGGEHGMATLKESGASIEAGEDQKTDPATESGGAVRDITRRITNTRGVASDSSNELGEAPPMAARRGGGKSEGRKRREQQDRDAEQDE
ncbi:hypothetical protein [Gordonia insulae]|uniref:HTH cro/C1-type domain-containing protein n=1 Tax=Gordonia insulae TaxID=2420509 RepID=A0A3G8JFV8_9ACTN|nr:hypothetical protein [Gordonia insulae]AZG43485.1 hypothetical protein D7316_00050 [Gordonia insulae]